MKFNDFRKEHKRIWDTHFKLANDDIVSKRTTIGEGRLLFPNLVLYTETDKHFIAELFGCTLRYDGLNERIHKESSISKYLYQFGDNSENPMFKFTGKYYGFDNLLLSRNIDVEKAKRRFGFDPCEMYPVRLNTKSEGGTLLSFGPNLQTCFLNNCLIINNYKQFYRMKAILHVTIVSKSLSLESFIADEDKKCLWPVSDTRQLQGIQYVPNNMEESYKLSGQFTNMFMVPNIREPNIGKFLHKNPSIIMKALSCSEFLYEKQFYWQEGNPDPSKHYIQPDFVLKSCATNYWDICDIKRPLLDKKNLTKGGHSRRRFIDYVGEGITQLANYKQYFSYPANANYAKGKYGVETNSPQLILIIGNYENVDIQEIKEASRHMRDNYTIIDWDSLNVAYLAGINTGMAADYLSN